MRKGVCGVAVVAAFGMLLLSPTPASAAAPNLSITVPTSVSFGSTSAANGSITASLGSVTVTTSAVIISDASWTATVTSTAFTTGGGTANETIPAANVTYLAGLPTLRTGLSVSACVPGQLTAVSLGSAKTAYTCSGLALLSSTNLTWNPTISVTLPASVVAGTYTGSIVHSVA